MIKLTYNQIANPDFLKAVEFLISLKISVKSAVSLKKSIDVINSESKTMNDLKETYIKQFGQEIKDEKGEVTGWSIEKSPVESQKECIDKLNDLFNTSFEIPLEPIELKDSEEISTKTLMLISDFLKD